MNINRRANLMQNWAPLFLFLLVTVGVLIINWRNDQLIRDILGNDAKYERARFSMIRNDIRAVHLKIQKNQLLNQRSE